MSAESKPHSGLLPDEIENAANLVARWMPNNDGYQGSTAACEVMAAYARHLEEQLEAARRALRDCAALIDARYPEGTTEYQVVLLARAALRIEA